MSVSAGRLGLVFIALAGLVAGGIGLALGASWAGLACGLATVPVLAALLVEIAVSLRRGDVGLDIVAALSMSAALAFGEPLAGNVVALMYAGGQLLESFAEGRARREMTALLGRVARTAMRITDEGLTEVPIEALDAGDRVLIRRGEVVPVDGVLVSDAGTFDQSALTGESLPVNKTVSDEVLSGITNAGDAVEITATQPAAESTYAGIVRLVAAAAASRAPSLRIADRYAIGFLVLTLVIAGIAWQASGDPVRALAVLVVATPCPLILALPVAIISGMSRAAKAGILIKTGGALEALAGIRTVILDKTGTLTFGIAQVADIRSTGAFKADELLRLAASLDQASGHVVAAALVAEAKRRGLDLVTPTEVKEEPGAGLTGIVANHTVAIGGVAYVLRQSDTVAEIDDDIIPGSAIVAVAVDGSLAGLIVLADSLRPEAPAMIEALGRSGVERIVLASGDRADVVAAIAGALPIDAAFGDLTPADKLALVRQEEERAPTLMVGDGVNDAPALAGASVGVAMGARGAAASSESADIVLLVDSIERLALALQIGRRTRRIAMESVLAGLGLSVAAMILAAFGLLPPVAGALLQEVIDVAVILNALRALR
ncbi:ATPase, P-type (transporting), HAD superfamily, subfamily IC/heavy metal translocating P-type ATPase [Kaistia soli DSM 19436]|uniref:P-type Zn(2+) transporter n=1 Tax=Kaistia soli DSM 19436 TaxID=1122133 RepID=A0A1M5C520_9HYPH|nr:heavy metal translocating P-type ATPase [Kaistia soli]SHF49801.1 ATPase, P-type (transporting), HAD superfamily, subfamily IC/heavy metal translocating P-type ATPase [Kaistia soli DSM 19436]